MTEQPQEGARKELPPRIGGAVSDEKKPMTPQGQPHEEGPVHEVTRAEGPGSPGGLGKPGRAKAEGGRDPHDLRRRAEAGAQSGGEP